MDRQPLAIRRKKLGFALTCAGVLLCLPSVAVVKAIGGMMVIAGIAIFIAGRLDQ